MLQGMLLAIVIVALAQLPWLVWLWVRERPQTGGGGGGSKRDDGPPPPPRQPESTGTRSRTTSAPTRRGTVDDAGR